MNNNEFNDNVGKVDVLSEQHIEHPYRVIPSKVEKFLKKYPQVEKSMKPFLSTRLLHGYKKWLNWKGKNEDKLGGRAETVDSPSFGSKTFYKHDFDGMTGWAAVFQYLTAKQFNDSSLYSSKTESITEASDKPMMAKSGNDILVDTTFVQLSNKFGKLDHIWMGDFSLETKDGKVEFNRVNKTINGFKGRAHELVGDKTAITKLIKDMKPKVVKESVVNEMKYSNQTGIKSSVLRDNEFSNLLSPKEQKWARGNDVKIYKDQFSFIFTDGKREMVFNLKKPYSVVKPMGNARSEIKKVYQQNESVIEEKVYIDFLNKKKGFKQDRIKFNSYEDAVKWARKNFDKFSPDMIKFESVNEGVNWKEFYTMAKDTSGHNPSFEKKYGKLLDVPHIKDAITNTKDFNSFMRHVKKFESINEALWPKSKLSSRFQFVLAPELKKKFKGIFYVDGYGLYHNDKLIMKINPDKDSVNSIVNHVSRNRSIQKNESINEASRRATDFFGDSKYGKAIHQLLKGKWDSRKVQSYIDKIEENTPSDAQYVRIMDSMARGLGLNSNKYKTVGQMETEMIKSMETLYKDFLTESITEASRRATDFFGDSKHGKALHRLMKGKWNPSVVEKYVDKLSGGNDVKYARIMDFIAGDLGLNIRKYKTVGEMEPEMIKSMETLYKDFLTESLGEGRKSLQDMIKDADRIKKEYNDLKKEYSKSKTETNKTRLAAKEEQLRRVANAIRQKRADEVDAKNESSVVDYQGMQRVGTSLPQTKEDDVELTESTEPKIITQLRDVMKSGYKKLKDPKSGKTMTVDSYSASAIVKVYDALKDPKNKEKFSSMGLLGMQSTAFKLIK
jgi:hypothetical protein